MKRIKRVSLVIVLLLLVVVILPTGAENGWLKSKLDSTLQARSGEGVTLLYDSVSVQGVFPYKRIVIARPRITMQTRDGQVVYSFDELQVKMLNPQMTHWQVETPGTIQITKDLIKVATVTASDKLSADVVLASPGSRSAEVMLEIPTRIAVAQEIMPEKPALVGFAEKPTATIKTDETGGVVYLRAIIKTMVAQGPAPQDRYTLADGNFIYQNSLHPDHKTMQDVELVLDKLTVPDYIHPYGPGTLIFRANLMGDITPTADIMLQVLTKDAELGILEASYNVRDFGLNLTGDMKTQLASIPSGAGHLVVRNVPYVLNEIVANNMLSGDRRALLYTLLSAITGDSVSNLKDANIALERKPEGEITIGGIAVSKIKKAIDRNDPAELK